MKYICILIIIFSFTSCKAIREFNKEDILQIAKCSELTLGNYPIIDVQIDSVNTKFILDTGSGLSVLQDSTIINNFEDKSFFHFGSSKGADRKKIKNKFFSFTLNSSLFKSNNKVLVYIHKPVSICSKVEKSYSGIIGLDLFFDENLSMQLDFSNNKVCNIMPDELQNLLNKEDYYLVKSECKNSQVFIFLNIENEIFKFKVDTGYSGSIIIPISDKTNFSNENKIELEGELYNTISNTVISKEVFYEQMPIIFENKKFDVNVATSNTIKAQNVGIKFIKAFDWIIDYNNNKVYIKKNKEKIENDFIKYRITYYAKANNANELKIVVKEKLQTKFNLGDQITSVNNTKVTPENICEMQDLLNKIQDWDTLSLEVITTR
jgi:hypothetical protein